MTMKLLQLAICLFINTLVSTAQPLRINEVMSSNGGVLNDEDDDSSDWIEFFNAGTTAVNLKGFGLSDKIDQPFQWTFPDYTVQPGHYLLVFASDKDRRDTPLNWNTIVSGGDDWKYMVPTTEPTTNWRTGSFNDTAWKTGKSGFGMGDNDDQTPVNVSRSIFLRKEITIADVATVKQLVFHMDYDDGFVAYLNGVEIARDQMAGKGALPRFDVFASGQHEATIYQEGIPEQFAVSNWAAVLKTGVNLLAIQVHNINTTSSDLSAIPFLSVGTTVKPSNPRIIDWLKLGANEFHTNFKLDADGESLYLTHPSGVLADSVRISPLGINYSFGRSSKDQGLCVVFDKSSPGEINSGNEVSGEMPDKPVFGLPAGVYTNDLRITITAPIAGDTIYYTLDGSAPTRASTMVIREIGIPTSKVVKARIFKSGMLPGEIVTNSYIIYGNKKMPVVSLSMTPADLWDHNTGIYVNGPNWTAENPHFGANYWMDWEKPVHFELLETTGKKGIDVDAGISIFGNWSRANAQKSLAIYCRKSYGYDEMKYKIFKERPYDAYKNVVLRNSGNDWNNTMFRDGLMSGLTMGLNLEQQAFRPAILFLNGEYWGIHNIREKINEHLIAQHNDVDPDSVSIVENHGTLVHGSVDDYWTMFSFAENNSLATQANYNKMLEYMDEKSFIDYFSSQIFFRNHDWPGNNIRYWKKNDPTGRWRWILFDIDFGMGIWNESPADNSLAFATNPNGPDWPNPPWSTLLLRKLLENSVFRNQFVNRFADLLNSNFRADLVNLAIDAKRDAIVDEIDAHLNRWNGSKAYWLSNVQTMKSFATARPNHVFGHIRTKFNFQSPQIVTAQADRIQGAIQLNSLHLTSFPWRGSYFPNVPITLTALPNVGYRFVKWTGVTTDSNLPTIQVVPRANLILTAVFESDGTNYQDVVINEISFNNNAGANPGDWIELTNKGAADIDISGWKITDSDPAHLFVFPLNSWLRPGDHLVVSNDLVLFNSVFAGFKRLTGTLDFGLSNSLDAVKLYSDDGQLIDEVNYTNTDPWKTAPFDLLWSLELTDPSLDNNQGHNWVLSLNNGTPGMVNTPFINNEVDDLPLVERSDDWLKNYPNPFNEGTYFEFKLADPGRYTVSVLDVNGRTLRLLKGNDPMSTQQTIYWDGNDNAGKAVPSGIYFYRLQAKGFSQVKRMVKM